MSKIETNIIWIWLICAFVLVGCNLTNTSEPTQSTNTTDAPYLVVAWVQDGNLVVWQEGDSLPRRIASGGVIKPYLAPDGRTVAFTRGPNGAPETLWVVDVAGTAEQQVVGDERPRNYQPGRQQVGDIAWFDESVLYFNTLQQATPIFAPRNDLYRANVRTREVSLILPAGEGGRMSISPNQEWIAVVSPGTYGRQDGRISVVDPLALQSARNLLFYVGVATGSEAVFYPPVQWLPDSSAVMAAIPDSDLIYSDTAEADVVPPTRIWQLPIATPSDRQLLNSLRTSFFGLPRWSPDTTAMTYLQRVPGSNMFTLFVADQTGGNGLAFLTGEIGAIEQPHWLPDSQRFRYVDPVTRAYHMVSDLQGNTTRLSEAIIFEPTFVTPGIIVYAAPAGEVIEIWYQKSEEALVRIGESGSIVPLFDAKFVR